jgi:hypothetical protein
LVAERPDEQLAPKMPILSALALYIAMRSRIDVERANTMASVKLRAARGGGGYSNVASSRVG